MFSRGGTRLPSIYADARYIDAAIVSQWEAAVRDFWSVNTVVEVDGRTAAITQSPDSDLDVKCKYPDDSTSGYINCRRLEVGDLETWEYQVRQHEETKAAAKLERLQHNWPPNTYCTFSVAGGGREYGKTVGRPDSDGEVKVTRDNNTTTGYLHADSLRKTSRSSWADAVRHYWSQNTIVDIEGVSETGVIEMVFTVLFFLGGWVVC